MDKKIYDLDKLSENFSTGVGEQIKKFSDIASITVGKHFGDLEKLPSLSNSMSEMVKNFPLANLGKRIIERTKDLQGPELYVPNFHPPIYSADKFNWNKPNKKVEPVVKLPPEAKWEYLRCYLTDTRTLLVKYNNKHIGYYGYDELGFAKSNTTDKKPNKQWDLLQKIAMLYSYKDGKLSEQTVKELTAMLKINNANLYQRKKSLSTTLQQAFGIEDDPFCEYLPTMGYRLKFKILPEPLLRKDGLLHASASKLLEEKTGEYDDINDDE